MDAKHTTGEETWRQLHKNVESNMNKSWRNTPRDANCTATCVSSRKLYRSDEPDTPDTAGEAKTSS